MPVRKQRKVTPVQELEALRRESAARIAAEEIARERAEREAERLAGRWLRADGSEPLAITPEVTYSYSETVEESRERHSRTASVVVYVFSGEDSLMAAIHDAAFNRGYASFKGLRWRVDQVRAEPYRNRSLSDTGNTVTLDLTAIPR